MLGHDVEGVENRAAGLDRLHRGVGDVGRAAPERRPAPGLRRRHRAGRRSQVVCGAPNARAGMKGVFAPAGTVIPRTGSLLKESVIRGVASRGMLCSAYELGLGEDHEGIIELPEDAPVGAPLCELCRPRRHRPRHQGDAEPRRLPRRARHRPRPRGGRPRAAEAARYDAGPGPLPLADRRPHRATDAACPLFLGRHLRGVRNGPSPRLAARRLEAIGLRPISALVDITNFLTFDLNRPLHVFDAGSSAGDLTVRFARPGETLLALNGQEYALDPEMTAIADNAGVQSLGGVIGGEATGCTEATTEVFIEAALFDPVRTAATGRKLNIASDARYRFERGLDPAFVG